jgi:hypothetical protein
MPTALRQNAQAKANSQNGNGANLGFEARLWAAADALRSIHSELRASCAIYVAERRR